MEDYVLKSLTIFFTLLVLYVTIKLVHSIWWRPKRIEKLLRQQGIRGTSYRFLYGDIPDMMKSAWEASSKPLPLNHQIVPRVIPFFHQMVQQYGKMSLLWIGRRPCMLIGDAELVKFILTNKNGHFSKLPRNPLVKLLHVGVSTLEGDTWSIHRRLVASAFVLERLKAMVPAISTSCCNLIQRWQELVKTQGSCELNLCEELSVLGSEAIARTAYGSSYQEGEKIVELQKEQVFLLRGANFGIFPGSRFIPTWKNKRRYQIYNQIHALLREMIHKKEQAMKIGALERHDILSHLIQCKEERTLTIGDVIEECKLLYFAGQETTTNLLTWTIIVLSMHPNWQEKAREEAIEICGKRTLDLQVINRLKIVSMVLHEVLRLYPPAAYTQRYTLCETRVGSISIPAGVELCLPFILLHHDRRYWDNPEEFNPERFAEGVSSASHDQLAFYPFGWGPRICLGQNFAFIEAKMTVAMILQHFSFQLSPSYAHAPHDAATLAPQHGAPIIVHRI